MPERCALINYDCLKLSPALFLTFTGLMPSESGYLMPAFREAWKNHILQEYVNKKERKRKYGGGRKPALLRDEDKLLFILFYFKIYPLQQVIAFLFGMSQSQACEWIHRLSAAVKQGPGNAGSLPERNPENLKEVLSEDGADEIIIDGTERRRNRPGKPEEQRKFYSGKKKTHTVKNNVTVTAEGRKVKYLSGTYEGKMHDKKICGSENPAFPEGIILDKDTGFQGYEPCGVITRQPKKKPRGGTLSRFEKNQNIIISSTRTVVEHVISGIKRSRIVKDIFRNTKEAYDDLVMEAACGLHNFRTELRSV
jgi:hypothetical protein